MDTASASFKNRATREPRRILILRPDHLGDLVLFSGMLIHIRNRWPSAHITLCVRSPGVELFAHCPLVDRLLPYEPLIPFGKIGWPLWFPGPWGRALISKLASGWNYDLVMLPMPAPWANHHRIMQWIPARERVGVRGNFENQTTADEQRYRPTYTRQMDATGLSWHSPELETNRLFLQFLGIDAGPGELWPEFWTTHGDASSAGALLGGGEGPLLGIAPGAVSPPGKRLPAGWFIDSVREARLDGTRIVLLGGRNEIAVCGEIEWELVKSGAREVVNAAGQTNVRQLVECIRACDFLLCADSAPLHIATALRKPVAGIMGGGHFGRFYPWGEPALSRVVSKPMECYGCNWTCKFETMRCVQEIHPSDAARELRVLYDHVLNTNRGLQPALQ